MAEKNANETQDIIAPQENIMKGMFRPNEREDTEETTAEDSKTYKINGQQYSTDDVDAMRDELASRTAQDNDVSAETAKNALDNGRYAEGYASDHPEEAKDESKENAEKTDTNTPENIWEKATEDGLAPTTPSELEHPKVSTLEYRVEMPASDKGISEITPATIVGGPETMPYIINGNEKQDPQNMTTEQLQEIVASADAADGRGTKESNMEALKGNYWQYSEEKEAEKGLEAEEGDDKLYEDPDYSNEDPGKKEEEHPDHPAPPEPPKEPKGMERLEKFAKGGAVAELADKVEDKAEDLAEEAKDGLNMQKD